MFIIIIIVIIIISIIIIIISEVLNYLYYFGKHKDPYFTSTLTCFVGCFVLFTVSFSDKRVGISDIMQCSWLNINVGFGT